LPQDSNLATYCSKIEKEDGIIDWNKSAKEIYQMWQAYTPWPGISTTYENKRFLLEEISYIHDTLDVKPGTVLKMDDGQIGIVCME
jgi:methionyl-tRNA formyltransferase